MTFDDSKITFNDFLETIPDAVVIVDGLGSIIRMNKQVETLLGYRREDVIGNPIEILIPAILRKAHSKYREHYFHHPTNRSMGTRLTLTAVCKNGSVIPVDISLEHFRINDSIYVMAAIRDISEIVQAYDETLDGWSRAMDFRDKETEGHTLRVTQMTVKIAHSMGFSETQITNIRRGALLHDIGKLAVPDSILYKPDKLTDDEWAIMRKHPEFAYEMLSPIKFLRSALDIPYCHHEKWDGTGYPRRLKGDEIPLAARIFAVVDVWDALRFDRPYRKGWSEEQVREYIYTQAGKHFDSQVADIFLRLLGETNHHNQSAG